MKQRDLASRSTLHVPAASAVSRSVRGIAVIGLALAAAVLPATMASAVATTGSITTTPAVAASETAGASSLEAIDLTPNDLDLRGLNYVALGDSYSAGFGLTPYSELPASGCFQADENYPHLVAAEFGLDLTDVTCSGAVTANIIDTPQTTIPGTGIAPVQSNSLSADTDIVTVTIGGNDLGFADVATFCVALTPTGPVIGDGGVYANCKDYFHPDQFIDQLAYRLEYTVAPALANTFALIAQKAPNAKVFVIGYPAISPDIENIPATGCFSSALGTGAPPFPENAFPFTPTDTIYLHQTEARLDAAIREQAQAHGATYLSTLPLSESHSACAGAADAFVNGISLIPHVPNTPHTGTPTPDPAIDLKLGALHPNPAGVAFLASQVTAAIQTAFGDQDGGVGENEPNETTDDFAGVLPTPNLTADAARLPATGADPTAALWTAASLLAAAAVLLSIRTRRATVSNAGSESSAAAPAAATPSSAKRVTDRDA